MIPSTELHKQKVKKEIKANIPSYWSKKMKDMFVENTLNFYELIDEIEYKEENGE